MVGRAKLNSRHYRSAGAVSPAVDTDEIKMEKVGIVDFVKDCKKLKEARKLSDHLPVWVEISF